MNIRKNICLTLFLTMVIPLSIVSCSSDTSIDEAIVGKWQLTAAAPNEVDDRAIVYLTMTSDGNLNMEFVLPDEYHEYLSSINFDPEGLRIDGTFSMGKKKNTLKITIPPNSSSSASSLLPDIHFFNGDEDIIYETEGDTITFTIQFEDRIYTEVYQKIN